MLEVCTSTMAWISVVVIQAFIHYFVLGARRDRIHKEAEAAFLEDSLSYSSNDGSFGSDSDMIHSPHAQPRDMSFSSIMCISEDRQDRYRLKTSQKTPLKSIQHRIPIDSNERAKTSKTPLYLTQTGTEMLKVC